MRSRLGKSWKNMIKKKIKLLWSGNKVPWDKKRVNIFLFVEFHFLVETINEEDIME